MIVFACHSEECLDVVALSGQIWTPPPQIRTPLSKFFEKYGPIGINFTEMCGPPSNKQGSIFYAIKFVPTEIIHIQ